MTHTRWLDLVIIVAYMVGMALVGLRFSRRQTNTETYFVAKRAVPSWAMGLSMLATLISSVTFVAYPGFSYAKDWSLLVPGFLVLGVLIVVGSVLIPFYRRVVGMSAYEYFEKRFGRPTRIYASIAFTLAHFSKMAFVFYLMALTINSITGWNIDRVILLVCAVMLFYTLIGGIEAVIWTDVIQAFLCWGGVITCLGYLLFLPPGGPAAVFRLAAENNKFSFGPARFDFSTPTIPVLILYGLFWYLQRYTADQTLVQRYLVAKSDRDALKGVGLGALLCIPVWALFMLVGTCTWAFFRLTGEKLPAYVTKADQVFPYFIGTHLPPGVSGLFMAALIGAAMTMLASDLNSLALVGVEDFYRVLRPKAVDRHRLRAARAMVVIIGGLSAAVALIPRPYQRQCAADVVRGLRHRFGRIGRPVPAGIPEPPRAPPWRLRGHSCQPDRDRVGGPHQGRKISRPRALQLLLGRSHDRCHRAHCAAFCRLRGQLVFPARDR